MTLTPADLRRLLDALDTESPPPWRLRPRDVMDDGWEAVAEAGDGSTPVWFAGLGGGEVGAALVRLRNLAPALLDAWDILPDVLDALELQRAGVLSYDEYRLILDGGRHALARLRGEETT